MRNPVGSLWNGHPGAYEDVNVYWDISWSGAWVCVPGYYVHDLALARFIDNGPGSGEIMNNNISSHRWPNGC